MLIVNKKLRNLQFRKKILPTKYFINRQKTILLKSSSIVPKRSKLTLKFNFTKDSVNTKKYFLNTRSKLSNSRVVHSRILKESALLKIYTELQRFKFRNITREVLPKSTAAQIVNPRPESEIKEKRSYLKHQVRLRYRWHFRSELGQFKLFRKFFKRSLKRYRKIQKNALFMHKFRANFSKLTGYNEFFIRSHWLHFHRNYNQYWGTSNAVLRFSQSLMLAPYGLLVLLKLAPSLASSKYIINTGSVSINGLVATSFSHFIPGDMMQINLNAISVVKSLFNYQKWSLINDALRAPYLHIDWSAMIIMLLRWPQKYELIAPSFLSERWVRYYIRQFPIRASKFKPVRYNVKTYKTIKKAK